MAGGLSKLFEDAPWMKVAWEEARKNVKEIRGTGASKTNSDILKYLESVTNEIGNVVPHGHGNGGQRHFGKMTSEAAYAAGIDTGRMAPGIVFFQHKRFQPGPGQMQRGGQPMQSGTDDDNVRPPVVHLHHRQGPWTPARAR